MGQIDEDPHADDEPFDWGEEDELFEWEQEEEPPPAPPPALQGKALIKEVCRLIRAARSHWDAHHNSATRLARRKAIRLYESLTPEQRNQVPQVLRVWLRYRSEKYFGTRRRKRKSR